MKCRTKKVITYILIIVSVFLIIGSNYYKRNFSEQTFDTILFYLQNGMEKSNIEVVGHALVKCIIPICIGLLILIIPITNFKKCNISIDVNNKGEKRKVTIYPNKLILNHTIFYSVTILIFSLLFAIGEIGVYQFIGTQINESTIFEDNYISTQDVKITFPEDKRNLIYIFMESMESTLMSQENGGAWEYSIIPELEKLANDNINFSNTEKLGGALPVRGTTWTVAGMLSQTSGVPSKVTIDKNLFKGYSKFMPGIYSLGDILKDEGYNLEIMMGSESSFGGRKRYFLEHGNYKIYDVNTAIAEGKMTEDDIVWWGFDDDDLFTWAKDEILELSNSDKPFNFIMLTADTHFENGYLSENVEEKFDTQYENVFAYSSKSVYNFVKWIQEQDFYDNTTIVIVGDHLGMQSEFYNSHVAEDYDRTVYNVFINSVLQEENNKNRQFSPMDIFPTVLASMGVEIEGERLGLGTNLFSGEPTLIEKYGYETVNDELSKKSNYYNMYLLQDNYIEMLKRNSLNNTQNILSQ